MKRVSRTLSLSRERRGRAAPPAPLAGHRPPRYQLVLEVLEDRTVPSTSVLGVPAPDLPAAPNLTPPPVTQVPVAAQPDPGSPLAQLLGSQAALSLQVPVPDFLQPSGTVVVATSLTGPLAITNFQVNNPQLDQLAADVGLPGSAPATLAVPAWTSVLQSSPAHGVVQLTIPPIRFEWLGLRVETNLIRATLTFDNLPSNLLARAEEIVSTLAQTLARVASVIAERAVSLARSLGLLQPAVLRALGRLAPPTPVTVHLAHYRFAPLDLGYQGDLPADYAPSSTGDIALFPQSAAPTAGQPLGPNRPSGPQGGPAAPPAGPTLGPNRPPGSQGGSAAPPGGPTLGPNLPQASQQGDVTASGRAAGRSPSQGAAPVGGPAGGPSGSPGQGRSAPESGPPGGADRPSSPQDQARPQARSLGSEFQQDGQARAAAARRGDYVAAGGGVEDLMADGRTGLQGDPRQNLPPQAQQGPQGNPHDLVDDAGSPPGVSVSTTVSRDAAANGQDGEALLHPSEHVTTSEITVDVYADTGPDKPVGNLLVAADRNRDKPGSLSTAIDQASEGPSASAPDEALPPEGAAGFPPGAAAGQNPLAALGPFSLQTAVSVYIFLQVNDPTSTAQGSVRASALRVVTDVSWRGLLNSAIPVGGISAGGLPAKGGPGSSQESDKNPAAGLLALAAGKVAVNGSSGADSPPPDDEVLPQVLPDVGLPDETAPPPPRPDDQVPDVIGKGGRTPGSLSEIGGPRLKLGQRTGDLNEPAVAAASVPTESVEELRWVSVFRASREEGTSRPGQRDSAVVVQVTVPAQNVRPAMTITARSPGGRLNTVTVRSGGLSDRDGGACSPGSTGGAFAAHVTVPARHLANVCPMDLVSSQIRGRGPGGEPDGIRQTPTAAPGGRHGYGRVGMDVAGILARSGVGVVVSLPRLELRLRSRFDAERKRWRVIWVLRPPCG